MIVADILEALQRQLAVAVGEARRRAVPAQRLAVDLHRVLRGFRQRRFEASSRTAQKKRGREGSEALSPTWGPASWGSRRRWFRPPVARRVSPGGGAGRGACRTAPAHCPRRTSRSCVAKAHFVSDAESRTEPSDLRLSQSYAKVLSLRVSASAGQSGRFELALERER